MLAARIAPRRLNRVADIVSSRIKPAFAPTWRSNFTNRRRNEQSGRREVSRAEIPQSGVAIRTRRRAPRPLSPTRSLHRRPEDCRAVSPRSTRELAMRRPKVPTDNHVDSCCSSLPQPGVEGRLGPGNLRRLRAADRTSTCRRDECGLSPLCARTSVMRSIRSSPRLVAEVQVGETADRYRQITLSLERSCSHDKNLSGNRRPARCITCTLARDRLHRRPADVINRTLVAYPASAAGDRSAKTAKLRLCGLCADPTLQRNPKRLRRRQFLGHARDGIAAHNPAAEQALGPPVNPLEMGLPDVACAVYRISRGPYRAHFERVWGVQSFAVHWPADVERVCSTPGPAPRRDSLPVHLSAIDRGSRPERTTKWRCRWHRSRRRPRSADSHRSSTRRWRIPIRPC